MAHTKTYYVLVLFLTFFFVGCKKMSKEYTTVEFSITNPADGTPFVGVPVQLYESESKNKGIASEVFMEGITDNEGKAVFVFKAAKTSKYWYVPVVDESYFGPFDTWEYLKRPSPSSYLIKKDNFNTIVYEITYFAYLKQITKNVNCEGFNDTLIYHCWSDKKVNGSRYYNYTKTPTGCYEYTTGPHPDWPPGYALVHMGWHWVEWEAHRTSGITYGRDSVFIDKNGLGTLEVLY